MQLNYNCFEILQFVITYIESKYKRYKTKPYQDSVGPWFWPKGKPLFLEHSRLIIHQLEPATSKGTLRSIKRASKRETRRRKVTKSASNC